MSSVKFNTRNFPWFNAGMTNWFDTDDFFADGFFTKRATLPAMNVKENPSNFELELAVPGFTKEDIKVSIENDVLHLSAEKKKEEVGEKLEGYTRKELSYNAFDRKIQLPSSVNQEQEVKASYKNGVLRLELSKAENAQAPAKKLIEII